MPTMRAIVGMLYGAVPTTTLPLGSASVPGYNVVNRSGFFRLDRWSSNSTGVGSS